MSLFNSNLTRFVNLEISALETDGKGKVISSNPRVVTSNNVKAVIEQGTEIPYQQVTQLRRNQRVVSQSQSEAGGHTANRIEW